MAIPNGAAATAANFNAAFASKSTANTLTEVQTNEKQVVIKEIATPSTPASGYGAVYFKTDGELYVKNDAGTESQVSNQSTSSTLAVTTKTTTYSATNADDVILCDATSAAFTVTLFAASGNTGKVLRLLKTDSSANAVTIDGNSSETIRGQANFKLSTQNESVEIVCDGTNWIVNAHDYNKSWNNSLTFTPTNFGSTSGSNIWSRRIGDSIQVRGYFTSGTPTGSAGYFDLPSAAPINSAKSGSGGSKVPVGHAYFLVTGSGSLGTGNLYAAAFYDGSDTDKIYFAVAAGSSAFTAAPGTSLAQNTSTFSFDFVYPVSGWEG